MQKKLKDLAKLVNGELRGLADVLVKGAAPIESAKEGDITFALDHKALKAAEASKASAVIAPLKTEPKKPAILVSDTRLALAQVLDLFKKPRKPLPKGIHKTCIMGKGIKIGEGAAIGANVVIEDNVKVGRGTAVYPGVFIGEG